MADTKTDEQRSKNMQAVRSRNTDPEVRLRKAVWNRGLRYFTPNGWKKLTGKRLFGSPDLVFPRAKVAVFLDGCFWHGCPVHYTAPDDNREFWQKKLARNQERDTEVNRRLAEQGWHVLRFWEHELRKGGLDTVADRIEGDVLARVGLAAGKGRHHEGEFPGLREPTH